jgi:DNA adenine methylase
MNGYPMHEKCGGLLMMPYEAGMPIPSGVDGVAFCTSCSPKRGLVAPGRSAFERARAASDAAGAREYIGELRASYVGKGARIALERALCGDGKAAKRKRNGFALCRSFQLVNDDGTATEAGRAFARRVGLIVPDVAPEPAPVIVAEPAPVAPTVEARSPLKWVGSKGKLLGDIVPALPETFGRLFVPFVGGGSLPFKLGARGAYLSDANPHLVNVYLVIRDRVEDLILALQDHKNERDYYEALKESFNDGYGDEVWRAGAFIYMNKVGFNGLCRYNGKGKFNVPFGDMPNAKICDAGNLRACSAVLQGATIEVADFRTVEALAQPGDLLYCDPPYIPESKTASFTGYWGKWTDQDHADVAALFRRLAARGVHVLASNSETPRARELYAGFEIRTLYRSNSVNSKASARGGKAEILVLGGTWTPRGAS